MDEQNKKMYATPGGASSVGGKGDTSVRGGGEKVSVEIFGDTYSFKTNDNPDYIRKLATMVDSRMKNVARRTRTFQGTRICVMAALEIADEYCKLKKDYDDMLALINEK